MGVDVSDINDDELQEMAEQYQETLKHLVAGALLPLLTEISDEQVKLAARCMAPVTNALALEMASMKFMADKSLMDRYTMDADQLLQLAPTAAFLELLEAIEAFLRNHQEHDSNEFTVVMGLAKRAYSIANKYEIEVGK